MQQNVRVKYLKDVLGIQYVNPELFKSEQPLPSSTPKIESLKYQVHNKGDILFLSQLNELSISEMQMLEKMIVSLKLAFPRVDIAWMDTSPTEEQLSPYKYIFYMGEENALKKTNDQSRKFWIHHPRKMNLNSDLKKDVWAFFKTIINELK